MSTIDEDEQKRQNDTEQQRAEESPEHGAEDFFDRTPTTARHRDVRLGRLLALQQIWTFFHNFQH